MKNEIMNNAQDCTSYIFFYQITINVIAQPTFIKVKFENGRFEMTLFLNDLDFAIYGPIIKFHSLNL